MNSPRAILLSILFALATSLPVAADVDVLSPDGKISISVGINPHGRLACTIHADGKEIVQSSPLGLTVDGTDLGQDAKIAGKPETREIHESYPLFGAHATARNDCREASVPLQTGDRKFKLTLRAYDDGAAIRYEIDGKVEKINAESTAWNLPRDGRYTWAKYNNSYEDLIYTTQWDKLPENGILSPPLTAEVLGHFVAISEANCQDFPDMGLAREGNTFRACFPASKDGWNVNEAGIVSPWRVTLITRDLTAMVNSDLFMNLCPAPDAKLDFSWVKPGRCMWQWCSVGAPKLDDQPNWYDAAARLKWEYYLIDDGWRTWRKEGKDQWTLLKEVIAYGNSKGVKSIVWVDSKEMRTAKASRAYLEKIKAAGAVGIKIDFFPAPTRDVARWQMELLRQTADLQLLCNFHGAVKPTGLRRTWPHELTREGVRGDEYQMTRYKRLRPMELDCNQPFNRLLVGPADITPVVLDPKQLRGYTWSHMFAQGIIFLSPVTHYYDQYKFYVESPMMDLFQDVPVTWDETRVLPGTQIGDVVAFARRKGDIWWIAVMNGASQREMNLSLDFLKSPGKATLVFDVPDKNDAIERQEKSLAPTDSIKVMLRPGGGFAARIAGQ